MPSDDKHSIKEERIRAAAAQLTEDQWEQIQESRKQEAADRNRAVDDPESLSDLRLKAAVEAVSRMTDQQREEFLELLRKEASSSVASADDSWPRNRLVGESYRAAVRASRLSGRPINQIIAEACLFYSVFLTELNRGTKTARLTSTAV